MSNQFWGHRVNLLLKSLVKSFVLCIALRVIKFFAVCQQFPFLYVNCFNRPAKGSSGTFLDLLQNISFLFLHEWILILVKWDEKIAFLCWTKFPGSYLSLSCLYPLWALLLFLSYVEFFLRRSFRCSWPTKPLQGACGRLLLKDLNWRLFVAESYLFFSEGFPLPSPWLLLTST